MLNQDYKDMLSLLLENNVEFLLVGAYAMAVHGFPRSTGDIDIFIKPNNENARQIFNALSQFGAPIDNISEDDFSKPDLIFQIGVAPCRIDLITKIDGLSFEEASVGKSDIVIDGIKIPVISKQNLIKNKLSTGREKDLLDAKTLKGIP